MTGRLPAPGQPAPRLRGLVIAVRPIAPPRIHVPRSCLR